MPFFLFFLNFELVGQVNILGLVGESLAVRSICVGLKLSLSHWIQGTEKQNVADVVRLIK